MTKEMKELIHKYWDEDKHDKIVEMIMAVPEAERDIDMLGQLVVAYNNLGRCNDAIKLSLEIEEESVEIPSWYYRIGYAYVRKCDHFMAADYLERGIVLANKMGNINSAKDCQGLYEKCVPYLRRSTRQRKGLEPFKMNNIYLDDYRKAIFVNGMTEDKLLEKLKQYEKIASGGTEKVTIKLRYFTVNEDWIYLDYTYAEDFEYWNFWHYQNLLLWLTDGKNDSFCLAYKEVDNYQDAFYSHANRQDSSGASVVGLFKGAELYYIVPEFYLEWMSAENTVVLNTDMLYRKHHIDVKRLVDVEKHDWKELKIQVSD